MQENMQDLRRSSRKRRQVNYIGLQGTSYPDGEPATDFERAVARLNQEAFPSHSFALADDWIVSSFFSTKRCAKSYRALPPSSASKGDAFSTAFFPELGVAIQKSCMACIPNPYYPTKKDTVAAARKLKDEFPEPFVGLDERLLSQCVPLLSSRLT
jgi:hypothetical protein